MSDKGSTMVIVVGAKTVSLRPTTWPTGGFCKQPACSAMTSELGLSIQIFDLVQHYELTVGEILGPPLGAHARMASIIRWRIMAIAGIAVRVRCHVFLVENAVLHGISEGTTGHGCATRCRSSARRIRIRKQAVRKAVSHVVWTPSAGSLKGQVRLNSHKNHIWSFSFPWEKVLFCKHVRQSFHLLPDGPLCAASWQKMSVFLVLDDRGADTSNCG